MRSDLSHKGRGEGAEPIARCKPASQKRVPEQPEAGFMHHINGVFATDIMGSARASAGLAGFVAKARR
jgi:hypothetical protein